MKNTSAQDEFSKWAKLRRQHDKAKARHDELAQAQQNTRTQFDRIVTALRWLSTQGANFGCNTWYAKEAMFWLPQGWVPYRVEWVLSLMRAPVGSVSVNVWALACAAVIGLGQELVMAVWTLRSGEVKEGARKGEKIRLEVPMVDSGGGGTEKKEL